jgi:hypothetical protein
VVIVTTLMDFSFLRKNSTIHYTTKGTITFVAQSQNKKQELTIRMSVFQSEVMLTVRNFLFQNSLTNPILNLSDGILTKIYVLIIIVEILFVYL